MGAIIFAASSPHRIGDRRPIGRASTPCRAGQCARGPRHPGAARLGARPTDLRRRPRGGAHPRGRWVDVDEQILERVDLNRFRPMLASDIEIKRFDLRWGNDYVMVANPRAMLYFRLEPWEAELLPLMDGTRTVGEITVARLEDEGDLDAAGVTNSCSSWSSVGSSSRCRSGLTKAWPARSIRLTPAQRRSGLREDALDRVDRRRPFRAVVVPHVLWPFFRPVGAASPRCRGRRIRRVRRRSQRSGQLTLGSRTAPMESLILFGLGYVLTFVHELGHAVTLVHFGRRVKSAGFMIYFGSPAFFVESSDSLMLDRRQRIVQSFAGPYTELVVAGVATLRVALFPDARSRRLLYRFALLNYFVIFLNLIPLLELDGYWILSDLIQVPGSAATLAAVHPARPVAQAPDARAVHQAGGRARALRRVGMVFTIFSLLHRVLLLEGDLRRADRVPVERRPGSRALLVLLVVFLAGPVIRGLVQLVRAARAAVRGSCEAIGFRSRPVAGRGGRADRRPARVRGPAGGDPERPGGPGALRRVRAGKPVFRQGDRPTRSTSSATGASPSTKRTRDRASAVLRTLGRGESFGEIGLLEPHRGRPPFAPIDDGGAVRGRQGHVRPPARRLDPRARVRADAAGHGRAPGAPAVRGSRDGEPRRAARARRVGERARRETIVDQGEPSDLFYVIRSGRSRSRRTDGRSRTLGPGAYFGEIALLIDVPGRNGDDADPDAGVRARPGGLRPGGRRRVHAGQPEARTRPHVAPLTPSRGARWTAGTAAAPPSGSAGSADGGSVRTTSRCGRTSSSCSRPPT